MARGLITAGVNIPGNNYAEIEKLKMRALMDAGARPFVSALANTGYQALQALQINRPDRNTWSQALQDTIGGWQAYRDVKGWGDQSWKGKYGGSSQLSGLGVLDWGRRKSRENMRGRGFDWNKFARGFETEKQKNKFWNPMWRLRSKVIGVDPYELANQAQTRYGVHDVLGELKTDQPSGNIDWSTGETKAIPGPSQGTVLKGGKKGKQSKEYYAAKKERGSQRGTSRSRQLSKIMKRERV
jgi:hypothetical protein